ncbi:MAG: phosphoglucomutase/phosphomannomutase family protein [Anaerolineae bacterium]|jgi:alpha-D-glucose phosphate-specific phosphoglucomutase|nr:phosphoglucomutase/phosphomannomutase family protein [Chloroflexota bacterium]
MAKSLIRFGTDGWRAGIAEDYTFENLRYCAQGTADELLADGSASKGMVVGYDTRYRSEDFGRAVAEVLAGNGIKTYLANRFMPTPVLSYAILPYATAGGIWITASHNPPTDNGFKLRSSYAGAAAPDTLASVEKRVAAAQAEERVRRMDFDAAVKAGLVEIIDPAVPYLEHLATLIDLEALKSAGLDLVVDPMWGVGQGWFPRLFEGGQTKLHEIHNSRNPLFPEMARPEPIADNLSTLLSTIVERGADAGVAFDGDADRVGFASEKGEFVNQLQVYALLAYYLLECRGKRGPLVRTISTTAMANKLAARYNVPVYETAVGFKYVAPKMLEVDAILGGEESGGFAFSQHIPERDGLLAGLFLLDLMVREGKTPSALIEHLYELVGPHYYNRIDGRMQPEDRAAVLARVQAARPESVAGLAVTEIDTRDGFRYVLEGGDWLLIRFSGTEPVIRVYCETTRADKLDDILQAGLKIAGLEG